MAPSTTGYAKGRDGTLLLKLYSLRCKLGWKAKCEPKFRFYSLYGHINREV